MMAPPTLYRNVLKCNFDEGRVDVVPIGRLDCKLGVTWRIQGCSEVQHSSLILRLADVPSFARAMLRPN